MGKLSIQQLALPEECVHSNDSDDTQVIMLHP